MLSRLESDNVGVRRGAWGESVAVAHLRRAGFEILDRNACPVKRDRRLEIDIVAWDQKKDVMVFVEVKQHAKSSCYARRLQSIDRRKRLNLRRACREWRRINKWDGAYRFDVIEIYGTPEGGCPIIDHIEDVELFSQRGRFVNWN